MNAFTLTLTAAQLQIISNALVEAPYKHVAALIQEINMQIKGQLDSTADPVSDGVTN